MQGRQPTADEARFFARLSAAVPGLLDWYHVDEQGAAWMCASFDVVAGVPEHVVETWRVDFDGQHLAGGRSASSLNWDDGVRAEGAQIDLSPPQGLSVAV